MARSSAGVGTRREEPFGLNADSCMDPTITDAQEWERLPVSDRMMFLAFGSLNPPIARFPHCIFESSGESLALVLSIVGLKGGVWGDYPPVDAKGKPYVPPWEEDPEHFTLWEIPENQSRIARGCPVYVGQFTMVIDTRTPTATLARMYSVEGEDGPYYEYIHRVSEWIDELRWAYIPLGDELDYEMFVVSQPWHELVTRVELEFRKQNKRVFRLKPQAERFDWSEPR